TRSRSVRGSALRERVGHPGFSDRRGPGTPSSADGGRSSTSTTLRIALDSDRAVSYRGGRRDHGELVSPPPTLGRDAWLAGRRSPDVTTRWSPGALCFLRHGERRVACPTREQGRQRALEQTPDQPPTEEVCRVLRSLRHLEENVYRADLSGYGRCGRGGRRRHEVGDNRGRSPGGWRGQAGSGRGAGAYGGSWRQDTRRVL